MEKFGKENNNNGLQIPFIPHPSGHLSVVTMFSSGEFSFKLEQFTNDKTIVSVTAIFGSASIKLPQGVIVQVEGSNYCICGSVNQEHVDTPTPNPPSVECGNCVGKKRAPIVVM